MHLSSRTGMTQVEINSCWREALRKENHKRVINEEFDFNPKSLIAITPKVNSCTKSKAKDLDKEREELAVLQAKLAHTIKPPK